MEHSFGTAVYAYAKGWYNNSIPSMEKHSDLENLKLFLAYYSGIDPKMVTNKDVLYSTFIVIFPIIKQCTEYTAYQYLQELLYVWSEYRTSQHCSSEDFDLEKEILITMLSILKLTPVVNQELKADINLSEYLIKYYRSCGCSKCNPKYKGPRQV